MLKNNIEKTAHDWVLANSQSEAESIYLQTEYYCQTRDIFQARLDKMLIDLLSNKKMIENDSYMIIAMVGEIGNNSFDHNLGSWKDIPGIFFGYEFIDSKLKVILADRGQGVLQTLRKARPEIKDFSEALKVAFSEKLSGRAPEARGNGLKFVRNNIQAQHNHLFFYSGNALVELNSKMEIKELDKNINGCLAILSF